jgi:hypothetical protein
MDMDRLYQIAGAPDFLPAQMIPVVHVIDQRFGELDETAWTPISTAKG